MLPADIRKRDAVVDAFLHAWSAYEKDAMGFDEYHPISHRGSDLGYGGGIGYTVVDALDTMILMDLKNEYARARKWVEEELSFDRGGYFSTFETTIRVLGGLLSAYHLTHDELYLTRATDLGTRFLPALHTVIPAGHVNLQNPGIGGGGSATIAEFTTLQLEFKYLAEITASREGEENVKAGSDFWRPVERIMSTVAKNMRALWTRDKAAVSMEGLAPISVDGRGEFLRSTIRMGSNGDSYYEYLLKQYLQTNKTEPVYLEMYTTAMAAVRANLVKKMPESGAAYIAELQPGSERGRGETWVPQPKQEHLACFLAGSLMLGATRAHRVDPTRAVSVPPRVKEELTEDGRMDWEAGVAILEGCVATTKTATGLAPEGFNFRTEDQPGPVLGDTEKDSRDWYIKDAGKSGSPPYDARYMLRPEISESVFLAWRLTGDPRYRSYAWDIFSAIERHCRLPGGGYATVFDVDSLPVSYDDKQETFFLSETLKYLFLTFADESVLSLDEVVFNTEAHPIPVFTPSIRPEFTKY
ncbi:glycoside hydrolase [Roridomyces roridus]|uniref:alpha-1,2-Mannosidase n=1 Tax=Roridomyces roridus TaxID=1738132 RepID=A0AAD7B4H9_9AGAR|nr:glycoside hydrolase [Roridomyces roridus]